MQRKRPVRRIAAALLVCMLLLTAACARSGENQAQNAAGSVVCTLFPIYDWTRHLLAGTAAEKEILFLQGSGADLHSYDPTAEDRISVTDCALLIYIGGESDTWLNELAEARQNKPSLRLLDCIDPLPQEGEHPHGEADGHGEVTAPDEHIWLSPENAVLLCTAIAKALTGVFPNEAGTINANAQTYLASLRALQADYRAAADAGRFRTLLVADRFPFRYLTEELGLDYAAAFPGCSADANVSPETFTLLSERLASLELPCVLLTETGDEKIAETVIRSSGRADCPVLRLDSMQSVTAGEANQKNYIETMRENLAVLKTALGLQPAAPAAE